VWWAQKTEEGTLEELYREFEAQYVPTVAAEAEEEIEVDISVPAAVTVVAPVAPVVPVAAPVAVLVEEPKKVTKKGKKVDL